MVYAVEAAVVLVLVLALGYFTTRLADLMCCLPSRCDRVRGRLSTRRSTCLVGHTRDIAVRFRISPTRTCILDTSRVGSYWVAVATLL